MFDWESRLKETRGHNPAPTPRLATVIVPCHLFTVLRCYREDIPQLSLQSPCFREPLFRGSLRGPWCDERSHEQRVLLCSTSGNIATKLLPGHKQYATTVDLNACSIVKTFRKSAFHKPFCAQRNSLFLVCNSLRCSPRPLYFPYCDRKPVAVA